MGKVVDDIRGQIQNLVLPADIMVNIGGEAEEQRKAFKDLLLLLILGVILVYMVMAAQPYGQRGHKGLCFNEEEAS